MARTAPLDTPPAVDPASVWTPSFAWWPHPDEYDATVLLSTYQVASEPDVELDVVVRGYAGSPEPLFECEVGTLRAGDQVPFRLRDVGATPPDRAGGIVEIHSIRRDRPPGKGGIESVFHWVDVRAPDGGGWMIPSQPYRGGVKKIDRDDVQVIPGVVVTAEIETDVVLLNFVDDVTTAQLTVTSIDGLEADSGEIAIGPRSAWRGELSRAVPRVRRLLAATREGEPGDGVGSLLVRSSRKVHPFFGLRRGDGPVTSMDHSAPIFS